MVAKSPIERILEFAPGARLAASPATVLRAQQYNADYQGETSEREQIPSLNVFVRREGRIHHFYNTEPLFAPPEPGQDPRHVDAVWPMWSLFDFTPDGRGTGWNPQLGYGNA